MRFIALLALCALAVPALAADPLETALAKPPATGLLIWMVSPDSQAGKLGVRVGDVLVSYNGVQAKSLEDLNAAKAAAEKAEAESVEVILVRGGEKVVVTMQPGQIGINPMPVTKDTPVEPLPPATDVKFDFSSLEGRPRDHWYSFYLQGSETKAGFEHLILSLEDGKLHVRREVAFDGGEQWGPNHMDATVVVTADAVPVPVTTKMVAPLTGWVGEGRGRRTEKGRMRWHFTTKLKDETGGHEADLPGTPIPEYLVEVLAPFMPRTPGACFHYRPLGEYSGSTSLPCALVSVGEEDLAVGEETIKVWRVSQVRVGGQPAGSFLIDVAGRVVHADYGGASARLTDKATALAGLNENLKPRTAK